MVVQVVRGAGGVQLAGDWEAIGWANRFLDHLVARAFSPATVRAYAFDLVSLARYLQLRSVRFSDLTAMDVFEWVQWQRTPVKAEGSVIPLRAGGAAVSTVNRRVAAVRSFYGFLVMAEHLSANPVPTVRRSEGLQPVARGLLGHLGQGRPRRGGRLLREPSRLPESLPLDEVGEFVRDLHTHRDRAIVLLMLLGGLRAAEVRGLLLPDVDQGHRRVRVVGKGDRERVVPVEGAFFAELAAYLRLERPPGLATVQCFVVLRGPTTGSPMTEAGLRSLFRRHRETSGAVRVRPHRLRHTYGTELASAGIDLLALRALMGHVSPDTTSRYVHLSVEHLAAEYTAARFQLQDRL
ncbi:MAG: tyrosine-type recombinase/integrase [Candidatus Nanopelagicales bacterium]|nr:tyrosine-type recombinase/integrase [Candidatus Nanopelagicales bacterium]